MNLEKSKTVQGCIDACEGGEVVAAVCAAPSILAARGLLKSKNATAFPSFKRTWKEGGAVLNDEYVCQDGQFLTGRGMVLTTQFGLALVKALVSRKRPRSCGFHPVGGIRKLKVLCAGVAALRRHFHAGGNWTLHPRKRCWLYLPTVGQNRCFLSQCW